MRFFMVTAKVKAPSIEKVETLTNGGKILSKTTAQLNRKDPTKFCFVYDWHKADIIHALFERKADTCALIAVVEPQNGGINSQLCEQRAVKAFAESLWHGGYIKAKRYVEMRPFSANEHWEDMAKKLISSNRSTVIGC